jgi:hypothetical protein
MKAWLMDWLPFIPPLLCAGIFNVFVAYQKLYRDCRSPLFKPLHSLGFYLWVLVQFIFPALVAFWFCKINSKPTVDFSLYGNAILIGLFFTVFVNANADFGFVSFPVDKIYAYLNELANNAIADKQTGKRTEFEVDLQKQLTGSNQLTDLLKYLRRYFSNDTSLKKELSEQADLLEEVNRALECTGELEQINSAISLIMKVRPKDCKQMLSRYGCTERFLKDYFD